MPPEDSPQKNLKTVESGLSRKRVEQHLRDFKPSKEFERKRRALSRLLADTSKQEAESRQADEYLAQEMESLDEGEKKSYEKTVEEAIDDILGEGTEEEQLQGVRMHIIRSVFTPDLFKEKYKEWQKEYEKVSKNPGFNKSEDEFVIEKGKEFILKNRSLLIEGRTQHRLDELGEKNTDEKKEEERREKIQDKIFDFVEKHEEDILSDEADLMNLKEEFLKIFYDNGHSKEDEVALEQLFWEIIGDIEYAQIVANELEATAAVMMEMSFMDLTAEEWEAWRLKVLKDSKKKGIKEGDEDVQDPNVYSYGGAASFSTVSEAPIGSVRDIANRSGVHLERVALPNEPGRYVYKIAFPHFKGIYEPLMEIRFPQGSTDFNEATYVIEDPYKDPDSGEMGQPLRRSGENAYEYNPSEVSTVLARLQLDKILSNVVKNSGEAGLTKESVNSLLNDTDLQKMAEQMLGFGFKDKPLLPPDIRKCENLLKVVARPDGRSFKERIKDMKIALNNSSLAPHLKKIFSRPGSEIMDVMTVIGEAKLARGGVQVDVV